MSKSENKFTITQVLTKENTAPLNIKTNARRVSFQKSRKSRKISKEEKICHTTN